MGRRETSLELRERQCWRDRLRGAHIRILCLTWHRAIGAPHSAGIAGLRQTPFGRANSAWRSLQAVGRPVARGLAAMAPAGRQSHLYAPASPSWIPDAHSQLGSVCRFRHRNLRLPLLLLVLPRFIMPSPAPDESPFWGWPCGRQPTLCMCARRTPPSLASAR